MSKIKMTPIRKSAKGKECTLRVSGYGGCSDPDTVVLCHAPCRDKGGALKSPDWWGAYGCLSCHDVMDARKRLGWMSHEEIAEAWLRGIYETHKILIEEGLIEIK